MSDVTHPIIHVRWIGALSRGLADVQVAAHVRDETAADYAAISRAQTGCTGMHSSAPELHRVSVRMNHIPLPPSLSLLLIMFDLLWGIMLIESKHTAGLFIREIRGKCGSKSPETIAPRGCNHEIAFTFAFDVRCLFAAKLYNWR